MKHRFQFSPNTDTLRLMPENYSVLIRYNYRWLVDMDAAIDVNLAKRIFELFHTSKIMDAMKGQQLADKFNILFL